MKNKHIILALILNVISTTVLSSEKLSSCLYLNEQPPITENNNTNYLLLNSAFKQNNCPSKKLWSIKNAKKTEIDGITILHNSKENMGLIKSISKNNIHIFKNILLNTNQNKLRANFSEASLSAFSESIQKTCNISIKLTMSKNKKLWLVSPLAVEKYKYCLNAAIIFAGHYVKFKNVNGIIYEQSTK